MITLRITPPVARPLTASVARVALVNWLYARKRKGRVLLRFDDTDTARDPGPGIEAVRQDLAWLGLACDGGFRQSERLERYAAAAERLRAAGRLYPCFESEAELQAKRDQRLRRGRSPVYDRAMLKMTEEQRARAEAGGKRPYWRFRLSEATHEWDDLVLGRCHVKLPTLSDPVVVRADGTPLHALTSVVDDIAEGVTHIVRGEEMVVPTGPQIELMLALGADPARVRFAHLPALAGGDVALRALRQDGVEPEAVLGYLAGLGGGAAGAGLAEMVAGFGFAGISPKGQRFEPAALLRQNRAVLAGLPFEAVAARLPTGATAAFWQAVRGRIDLLAEAREYWEIVAGEIIPPVIDGQAGLLREALALLPPEPWTAGVWGEWTGAVCAAAGCEHAALDAILRLALTGEEDGPEMRELLPLLGRPRTVRRLEVASK